MAETRYEYDFLGNRTKTIDANGHEYVNVYDLQRNFLTETTDPLGNPTTFGYDPVGNLIQKKDAKGKIVTYAYDGNRNLLSETVDDAATPAVTYGYDNLDRRTSVHGICCNWTYQYDSLDQLIQESWAKPDPSDQLIGTNVYGYDQVGNRTAMQWTKPGGDATESRAFSYTFDAVNRLTSLAETGGPGQTQYTYDDVGNLTRMVYPNGIETRYTYDRMGRITQLENRTAGAVILSRFVYAYDWASRRTRIDMTRRVPAQPQPQTVVESVEYGYDLMSRLTSETRKSALGTVIYSCAWTYDGVGNRTEEVSDDAGQVTWKTYTYDAADRLILEEKDGPGPASSTTSYVWDDNGNLIKKTDSSGTTMYAWDYRDRLVTASLPDGRTVEFGYCDGCALGKRMSKIVRAPETAGGQILSQKNYVWDGQNIIGELDEDDNVIVDYTVMPLSLMDNVISMQRDGADYYYLYDAMGTVWQVVNASGAVVNSYDYDAWGVQRSSDEGVINPFRWQTKPWDDEVGMYYSRARYYDAGIGRFVSKDPNESLHVFHWPTNSPTNILDPSGLAAVSDITSASLPVACPLPPPNVPRLDVCYEVDQKCYKDCMRDCLDIAYPYPWNFYSMVGQVVVGGGGFLNYILSLLGIASASAMAPYAGGLAFGLTLQGFQASAGCAGMCTPACQVPKGMVYTGVK